MPLTVIPSEIIHEKVNKFLRPVETFALSLTNKFLYDLKLPIRTNYEPIHESYWRVTYGKSKSDWVAKWYQDEGEEIFENFKNFLKSNASLINACYRQEPIRYDFFWRYQNSFIKQIIQMTQTTAGSLNVTKIPFLFKNPKFAEFYVKILNIIPSPWWNVDFPPEYKNGKIFESDEEENKFFIKEIRLKWLTNRRLFEAESLQLKTEAEFLQPKKYTSIKAVSISSSFIIAALGAAYIASKYYTTKP